MTELLIVLMMAFNLWMVTYLTWERRGDNKAESGREKDCGMKGIPDDIMGKSRFRMVERKPQAATIEPNAATVVRSEAVDEEDVTFADEMDIDGRQALENKTSRQVSDEELDETLSDSRVLDMVEYDGDEDYNDTPHEASGATFEDIDPAMWTVKKPKATGEERRHVGMMFCDMRGNGLFALIERSLDVTRRKPNGLMGYYLNSVSAAQVKPVLAVMPKKALAAPDNSEDFNTCDFI